MTAAEVHAENSRRMRDFFRNYSMALYTAAVQIPEPPLLTAEHGIESRYVIPQRQSGRSWPAARMNGPQIGPGPDPLGYYLCLDPDLHQVGDLYNDPVRGGVWCRVETPLQDGSWEARWLRVM